MASEPPDTHPYRTADPVAEPAPSSGSAAVGCGGLMLGLALLIVLVAAIGLIQHTECIPGEHASAHPDAGGAVFVFIVFALPAAPATYLLVSRAVGGAAWRGVVGLLLAIVSLLVAGALFVGTGLASLC